MFDRLRGARSVQPVAPPKPAVLVVEDDKVIRRLLSATLRAAPVRILEAETATEGLRLARHEHPILVLLDVGLGGEDGVGVCAELKRGASTSSMQVVMVSGRDDPVTRARARRAGADGFLAKPFSPLAIFRTLDKLLTA